MRIGVNALFLEPGMGGLETYVKQLVPELAKLEPNVTVLANARGGPMLRELGWSNVETQPVLGRRGLRFVSELTALGALATRRFDALLSPALTGPLKTSAANVVVLADTTWITVPDLGKGQALTVRAWQAVVPHVARRADRVVAISEAGARDVAEHLGVPRERIDVVPLGYTTPQRRQPTPAPELRARLGLGQGQVVLNIAMKKAHKNLVRLIEALPAIRDRVPGAQLVLAGAPTPYEEELRTRAALLGLADHVAFPGYVDDADLEGLYALADVFVFPSLNEGFGLPVLEAMGRGVPVVTSNVSALPEVAGDAALLVDPRSVDAIAAATVSVLTDPLTREGLVTAGRARVADFTWERTARETLESLQRAA